MMPPAGRSGKQSPSDHLTNFGAKDADYKDAYDALGEEFDLARAVWARRVTLRDQRAGRRRL
jgi:hypothetical protein